MIKEMRRMAFYFCEKLLAIVFQTYLFYFCKFFTFFGIINRFSHSIFLEGGGTKNSNH